MYPTGMVGASRFFFWAALDARLILLLAIGRDTPKHKNSLLSEANGESDGAAFGAGNILLRVTKKSVTII
jgi:hypothetical protein